jgi:hypothetical protein
VFVVPDPDYFVRFAAAHGEDADRAFFRALKATYPDGVRAVYVEQQTDYSGCTRFGGLSLVDTYRAWTEFEKKFPNRYTSAAKAELNAVLHELTQSTCACGDIRAVETELQRFLNAFPQSPVRLDIERRLQALRAGTSNIRVQCVSG